MDIYQKRYLKHQLKKKKQLLKLMKKRHSSRVFTGKKIEDKKLKLILKAISLCPSSCNRKAVSTVMVRDRDRKELLTGLLVGGVGWIHRADTILLLTADPKAYKENLPYMPYLDAGVIIQQVYLIAESLGLKVCYVNPNIREENRQYFKKRFTDKIFCGALALG